MERSQTAAATELEAHSPPRNTQRSMGEPCTGVLPRRGMGTTRGKRLRSKKMSCRTMRSTKITFWTNMMPTCMDRDQRREDQTGPSRVQSTEK